MVENLDREKNETIEREREKKGMTLESERAKKIECKHGAKKGTNKPNRKKIQIKFRLNGTKRASFKFGMCGNCKMFVAADSS